MTTQTAEQFSALVYNDLLPDFCGTTAIDPVGFRGLPVNLDGEEIASFLLALDRDVVERRPGARFIMPQSRASIALFWHGPKATEPRPINFARETLWSCGAAALLHLNHYWPLELLGIESKDRAFDVVAVRPEDLTRPWIAGEVKSSRRLLERLLNELSACFDLGLHERDLCQLGAHQKYAGLVRSRAPVFWGLAPGWIPVFTVRYDEANVPIGLDEASVAVLDAPHLPFATS